MKEKQEVFLKRLKNDHYYDAAYHICASEWESEFVHSWAWLYQLLSGERRNQADQARYRFIQMPLLRWHQLKTEINEWTSHFAHNPHPGAIGVMARDRGLFLIASLAYSIAGIFENFIGLIELERGKKSPLRKIRGELEAMPLCKLRQQLQYIGAESFIEHAGALWMLRPTKSRYTSEELKVLYQLLASLLGNPEELKKHAVQVVPFLEVEFSRTTNTAVCFINKVTELIRQ